MSQLIHPDFLLQNGEARRLYHDYAAKQPILDYHTHLPPEEIAADRHWANISQVWLNGDHYKWRQMRANGISERYCTGNASDREKFDAFASVLPYLLRNPLYHWCHLELARYFEIDDLLLSPATAGKIWERTAAVLQGGLSARALVERSNVVAVCTSDDPIDALEHHAKVAADPGFKAKMLPTWRPGKVFAFGDAAAWNAYVDRLAAIAETDISRFDDLVAALAVRCQAFHQAGCRLSDHALTVALFAPAPAAEIDKVFARLRAGEALSALENDQLTTALLLELARIYHQQGWTLQIRIGAMRNTNDAMFAALGPDSGYDAMGDRTYGEPLARLLNALYAAGNLPRTILYNVNPRDFEMLASLLACFEDGSIPGKMQLGPAWWFLDQKDGMERQLEAISQIGSLRRFVGMVADSRSFLSFTRHEYFRRVLCNLLGADMAAGLLPRDFDLVGALVEDVCFRNAERYFGFELAGAGRAQP